MQNTTPSGKIHAVQRVFLEHVWNQKLSLNSIVIQRKSGVTLWLTCFRPSSQEPVNKSFASWSKCFQMFQARKPLEEAFPARQLLLWELHARLQHYLSVLEQLKISLEPSANIDRPFVFGMTPLARQWSLHWNDCLLLHVFASGTEMLSSPLWPILSRYLALLAHICRRSRVKRPGRFHILFGSILVKLTR